ncbi:MAG: phosphotransferase [Acidimicrobiales bacterium]
MIGARPFPKSVDQLDVEFLSAALERDVQAISTRRIGADRGMLGDIFLVTLDTSDAGREDDGSRGPAQLVAKFASPRDEALATARRGRTNERELRCYDDLLQSTPVTAPAMYGAWYDPDTAEFLLLQEAIDPDETVDQLEGLSVEQARLVLSETACIHARWFEDPALGTLEWLPPIDGPERRHNLTTLADAGWGPLCELLGDSLTEQERQIGIGLADRIDHALVELAEHKATLLHGDLRADNLLFTKDGAGVYLIDWQGSGVGPPSWDLAYFLSQSLAVDVRRAHEDALIEHYRVMLADQGLALSTDEILTGYDQSMLFGLAVACALPLINDTSEPRVNALAHTIARRAIEALRDHYPFWEGTQ